MHFLVIGRTGQLARAISAQAEAAEWTATFIDRNQCDLSSTPKMIEAALHTPIIDADAVIIAAAYTDVDAAESDYETALAVNGTAPGVIATLAAQHDKPVIYISTDYVFLGDANTPYRPETPTNPLNAYGRSKAVGERAVREKQPRSAILRTSWVYDNSGKNFLTTMLGLAETRDTLNVVNDQIGRPTHAGDLAEAVMKVAMMLAKRMQHIPGIYHVTNTGQPVSWADFARTIFEQAGKCVTVKGIPSSEYPMPAMRPLYSVMDTGAFETQFSMPLRHWQQALFEAIQKN